MNQWIQTGLKCLLYNLLLNGIKFQNKKTVENSITGNYHLIEWSWFLLVYMYLIVNSILVFLILSKRINALAQKIDTKKIHGTKWKIEKKLLYFVSTVFCCISMISNLVFNRRHKWKRRSKLEIYWSSVLKLEILSISTRCLDELYIMLAYVYR